MIRRKSDGMVVFKTLLCIVGALLLVLVCVMLVGVIISLILEIKDMIEWSEIKK